MNEKDRTNYKRAFNEKAYDRISITIPKGQKRALETFVKERGESSINGFTNRLYRAEMGLTEEEWKKPNEGGEVVE